MTYNVLSGTLNLAQSQSSVLMFNKKLQINKKCVIRT